MNSSCEAIITLKLQDLYPNCSSLVEYMWGYVIPVIAAVIIVVNGMIVSVLARPNVRSHTTLILILIACSDTLNLVFPSISYIYHYTSGRFKDYLSYSSCFWTYIFAEVSVDMFNMISLWLTVLLAYIRSRCLRSPFKAYHIHTNRNVFIYLTAIVMLAMLVHLPALFLFEFTSVTVKDNNTNSTKVVCGISEARSALLKPCAGRKLQMLMETVIDSFLPCVILVCCNVSILATLHKAKRERSSLRSNCSITREERKFLDEKRDISAVEDNDIVTPVADTDTKTSRNKGLLSIICLSRIKDRYGVKKGIDKAQQHKGLFANIHQRRNEFRRKTNSTDSEIDKLDRESRRTTWLIFVIASMILLHEIPVIVTNANNLAMHVEDQLPLNFYGCFSMFLVAWQFITYPVILIIYACMSGSIRAELTRTFTCCCTRSNTVPSNSKKIFMSPCTARKSFSRERSLGNIVGMNYDFDTDM